MKKMFIKLIVISVMSICTLAGFNYYTDPYGIFHDASLDLGFDPGYEPNQHYAKMRHLINDKHGWDSYIFGSSRVGKIDPARIPGGSYYNMNYSEGVPGEHLADIKLMLSQGLPVKNVVIGIDNMSYLFRPSDHRGQMLRHPYDASMLDRALFKIKYLCFSPRISIGRYLRFKRNEPLITFGILDNGLQDLGKIDRRIEADLERHLKDERFRKANNVPFDKESEGRYMRSMDDMLLDIKEIVELSQKHDFKAYFFINPTHIRYYMRGNPDHLLILKEKLAGITGYWDFSGFNSVTTDNYNYYETSHYRTMVGDLITCRMTGCSDRELPEDFGIYITGENADLHIMKQREELAANRP